MLVWLVCSPAWPDSASQRLERELLNLTNQARAAQGLNPLAWDEVLAEAARGHSQDMADLDFFDHISPVAEKAETLDRVVMAGGSASLLVAENLFWCSGYPAELVARKAVDNWLSSQGHRDNLLGAAYHKVGVGVLKRGQTIWVTQVFAE